MRLRFLEPLENAPSKFSELLIVTLGETPNVGKFPRSPTVLKQSLVPAILIWGTMGELIDVNTEAFLAEVSRLRGGTHCKLREVEVNEGGSNAVYVVEFDDSFKWAARMPRDSSS